jgi:hypothetical protein
MLPLTIWPSSMSVFQVQAVLKSAGGSPGGMWSTPPTPSRFGWAVQNYLQQVQGTAAVP